MAVVMEVFDEVGKRASDADWEGCFEACNKVISECPEQRPIAQKCQLFCLLKQGNFQQALDLLKQIGADNLTFEKAYALYGLKRYKEAIKHCGDSFRDQLLKAQSYYQLEEYSSSLKVYESLLDKKEFEKYTDTNLTAVESCMVFQDENYKPHHPKTVDNDDSDLLYNYGCLQLICQNLEEAERSFRACEEKMIQEGDADAINARLQLAATLQMSGKVADAKALYKSVLESCSDPKPTTLATINCLLLNEEKVPIDQMRKKLKKLSDKLAEINNMQKMCLLYNERLLSVETGQCSDARPFKAAKNSKLWEPCNYMYLTWLMKQKKYQEALQLLKNDNSEEDALLKVKILAAQGSFLQAAEVLEGIGNSHWAPIICDLYSKANGSARLKKYVTELFDAGTQSSHAIAQISRGIMRLPAVKKDNQLLRLVQSSIELPDLNSLFGEMTVEDVERSLQSADSLGRKRHRSMAVSEKVKRRKKNKPPKSLDKPIDPERWLPLKERSYYRHARRRGVKHTGKKTIQGVAETTESEQWLGEKTPAACKQEATAATQPKKPASLQGKGPRSKRKKRDKW